MEPPTDACVAPPHPVRGCTSGLTRTLHPSWKSLDATVDPAALLSSSIVDSATPGSGEVFDWALGQDVVSVYASEYIRKVEDFQHLTLARRLDGCWQVRSDGSLTTLRLDSDSGIGAIDSARSTSITSVRSLPQGRYVALDGSGRAVLCAAPAGHSKTALSSKRGEGQDVRHF